MNEMLRMRPMMEEDLVTVLEWRNHIDVRRYMFAQTEITLAGHKAWFQRESQNPKRHLLIFEVEHAPLGFVNLLRLSGGVAEWGFYTAPCAPKGTGLRMGRTLLPYAFEELGCHKIFGQVIASNERSSRFHERLKFKREGVLREHFFNGVQRSSVICYGLLASEWAQE